MLCRAVGRCSAAILERVGWWAEVFEIPCVALAASLDEVGALAAAGADFVAVGDFIWTDPAARRRRSPQRRNGSPRRRPWHDGGAHCSTICACGLRSCAGDVVRSRASEQAGGRATQASGRAAKPAATAPTEEPDLAYGAFQRGLYVAAFREATRRIEQKSDTKAMTLLGELYADGLGVRQDDNKAAEWYRLAAGRGDREAMFALAMFHMNGRGGPRDRDAAAKLFAAAAKLGHPAAAYNLALLYLEGQLFPQDFKRAAELLRIAAQAGNPEAQYALATFYKEGRGVPQDLREAARLLGAAALADNTAAEVEYGIALFNGTGIARNEAAAATYLTRAARRGNPIAQNRLAFMYAMGRGVKLDPVQAARWHLIARAGGSNDLLLEDFLRKMKPEDRAAGEAAAKPWIASLEAQQGRRRARSPRHHALTDVPPPVHLTPGREAGGHGQDQRQRHPARHGDRV